MKNPLVKYAVYNLIAAFLGAVIDGVVVTAALLIQNYFYPQSIVMSNIVYFLGWGLAWLFVLKTCYVVEAYFDYRKYGSRPVHTGDYDSDGHPL